MIILNGIILVAAIVLLILAIFNSLRQRSKELLIWMPALILLIVVFFVDLLWEMSQKAVADGVRESAMANFTIGFVAVTFAVFSTFLLAKIDPDKRIYPYYAFATIFLGLFLLFTVQFGGTVNQVLTLPIFYAVALAAVVVIFIYLYKERVTSLNRLVGNLGWVLVLMGFWLQFSLESGIIVAKLVVIAGLLALGFYIFNYRRM